MTTLASAKGLACELIALLGDKCERIEVAGSIRRLSPSPGDIELVVVPKLVPAQNDLFGEVSEERNLLLAELNMLVNLRMLSKRASADGKLCWGPRHQRALYKGVPVDVFQVLPPAQWGAIMAIRTGPAEFARRLVTKRSMGGFMPENMRVTLGALWREGEDGDYAQLETPTEDDFFQAIGYADYPKPEDRR